MTKTTKIVIAAAVVLAAVSTPVAVHHYWPFIFRRPDSIHIKGQLRTPPGDNFSAIAVELEPVPVEIWKDASPKLKWRVEKPERVAVMDGQSTVMYMKSANMGVKFPQAADSAFDTDWFQQIANVAMTFTNNIRKMLPRGAVMNITREIGGAGNRQIVVAVQTKSGLSDHDYMKDKSLNAADTRRVYRFDEQTRELAAAEIYIVGDGDDQLIFQTTQIETHQAIAPSVFHLDLPADISWYQEPQKLPDNQKYASMTADQAARAFFEACSRQDWDEVGKFVSPLPQDMKKYIGGLELVSLGKPFKSKNYPGQFIPYEIKLLSQTFNVRVSNANAAKRCVLTGVYNDQLKLQQDLKWTGTPEILTNNEEYAKVSPAEAVKAYFAAQARFDWVEMRKFTSEADVKETRAQVEQAKKMGVDAQKMMPAFEVGEAVWSDKESAWFVKCQSTQIKKWNLAMRKDNAAGRWQVDGGF